MSSPFRKFISRAVVSFTRTGLGSVRFVIMMCFTLTLVFPKETYAQQERALPLESELKDLIGIEKLKALNLFVEQKLDRPSRKTIRYAKQAVSLAEKLITPSNTLIGKNDEYELLQAYYQYGKVLYNKADYFDAQENFYKARSTASRLDTNRFHDDIKYHLQQIRTLINSGEIKEGIFSKTIGSLKIGEAVNDVSSDIRIQTELKLAKNQEEKREFRAAIEHYKKSIRLLTNQGDSKRITELNLKIASLLDSLGQPTEVQQHLAEAIENIESLTSFEDSIYHLAPKIVFDSIQINQQSTIKSSIESRKDLKNIAEEFERKNNFKKSLEYFKLYESLSAKFVTDSLRLANREREIILLKQQKLLADKDVEAAELEKERHRDNRNLILLVSLLLLGLALTSLFYYISKRSQHRKLSLAYTDLNQAKSKLQDAEQRIRTLLKQQVSGDIAAELITNDSEKLGRRHFVCIMFLDIRDFTPMAEKMSPEALISFQNKFFGFMMDIVQRHYGNINQLMGDGFMATFGAPISHGNDCGNAFRAAKEILAKVEERNKMMEQETHVGIGLHAGDVVTGNVGNENRKQYSVTGNAVIIASRVEQLNKKYNSSLIITEEVANNLPNSCYPAEKRDFKSVKVKGRKEYIKVLIVEK